MKKTIKSIFWGKNWGPDQWFCSCVKSSKSLKKKFSKKKFFQLICTDMIFKTVCGNFLKINGSRDIYILVISRFQKTALHNKIINKTRSTKNKESTAQRFGDNYPTHHLVNFLQDRIKPWRFGALRICTVYNFFKRKSLVTAF